MQRTREALERWFNVPEVRLIESRDEHARCVFKGGRPKEEKASDACFHEGSRSRSDESDLEAHLGEQPGALGGAIHRRGQVCEKEREREREREREKSPDVSVVPFERRPSTVVEHRAAIVDFFMEF